MTSAPGSMVRVSDEAKVRRASPGWYTTMPLMLVLLEEATSKPGFCITERPFKTSDESWAHGTDVAASCQKVSSCQLIDVKDFEFLDEVLDESFRARTCTCI